MRMYIIAYIVFVLFSISAFAERQVKVVYFVPNDRTIQWDLPPILDTQMRKIHTFYADEMERHGFGRKTFDLSVNTHGQVVQWIQPGIYNNEYYLTDTFEKVYQEISAGYDIRSDIYVVFLDTRSELIEGFCGLGQFDGGMILVPATGACVEGDQGAMTIAHELGHAFNLVHDFRSESYMMSYGQNRTEISTCAASVLNVNRHFSTHTNTPNTTATIEMLTPLTYISNEKDLKLEFKVTDPDSIYQIQFILHVLAGEPAGVQHCKQYEDTTTTNVEFTMPEGATAVKSNKISIRVFDKHGYVKNSDWTLQTVEETTITNNTTDQRIVYLSFINGDQPIPNEFGLNPKNDRAEWSHYRNNELTENQTPDGNPLVVGGQRFQRGLCMVPGNDHRKAILVYDLTGADYTSFEAYLGTADEQDAQIGNNLKGCTLGGSVIFSFDIDGHNVYTSPQLTGEDAEAVKVSFNIPIDAKEMQISVDPIEDKGWCDSAVLGDAKLLVGTSSATITKDDTELDPPMPPVETEHDPNDADVNDDGVVNVIDLVIVAINFGAESFNPKADLNGDGKVDGDDIRIVLAALEGRAAPAIYTYQTELLANYPNPFNPETWIPYQLASDSDVQITIYAANGQIVRTLDLGLRTAGRYIRRDRAAYWDGLNMHSERVVSGVYFYTLIAGNFTATRKMLIKK